MSYHPDYSVIPPTWQQTAIHPEDSEDRRRRSRHAAQARQRQRRSSFWGGIAILLIVIGILGGNWLTRTIDPPKPPCEEAGWVSVTPAAGEGYTHLIKRTTLHVEREPISALIQGAIEHNGGDSDVTGEREIQVSC